MIVHILHDVYDLGRIVTGWTGLAYLGWRKANDTHVIDLECKRYVLCNQEAYLNKFDKGIPKSIWVSYICT